MSIGKIKNDSLLKLQPREFTTFTIWLRPMELLGARSPEQEAADFLFFIPATVTHNYDELCSVKGSESFDTDLILKAVKF